MNHVPPELNELMWHIAQQKHPDAIRQFEQRHPQLKSELQERLKTVTALTNQGRAMRPGHVPEFRWRPKQPHSPLKWTWPMVALCGTAFASVVAAAVVWNLPTRTVNIVTQVPVAESSSTVDNRDLVTKQGAQSSYSGVDPNLVPLPTKNNAGVDTTTEQGIQNPEYAINLPQEEEYRGPKRSMHMRLAKLHDAISAIATAGGISVMIAPGLPNPEVEVDFEGMTTRQMLDELGSQYAFVAKDDGTASIIVLPKNDEEPERKREEGFGPP